MSVPPRPFRDEDAPGRIPESLIDSVLDGAVDERTRREVARALRHDPRRREEVGQTIEAISALREPVACPDFSTGVLADLERKHRFIAPRVRRLIGRTRAGLGLAALIALTGVAVAQRAMPRLAGLGDQPTPVTDVARAMGTETAEAAGQFREGVRMMQASMPSLSNTMKAPGLSASVSVNFSEDDLKVLSGGRLRVVAVEGGRFVLLETEEPCRAAESAGGLVSSLSVTRTGGAASDEPAGAETLP